ncbi:MAG: cyclopropane fatty acyl phospholipid synthase [Myxococcales bacterium]|nr:cyclopropane fatty acyl phospholipid synthase [Myxococcales bacterium]MCB9569579.1 cyclopropane fatty acyl phospholipid synthase [Myxococcales bacterium]MCB9706342.1 cyclopropane fatty acyl phospholipid synthase [Myxococcales bacterium]
MQIDKAERIVRDILAGAGVTVGGSEPWDITVHDRRFYPRLLKQASLGLGESYMDGWWETPALEEFIGKILRADLKNTLKGDWRMWSLPIRAAVSNLQSKARAYEVAEAHYDLGNDLYQRMLDKRMVYTCGYWRDAKDLDEAQEAKLDLICRKVGLEPGMEVLDLGCGWGGFAAFAAERYGCKVRGVSVSKEQVALAREMWKDLPVEFILGDYRDMRGSYDAVVSIGMAEHVGYKNHRTMMQVIHRCLRPEGVALVHTIANNVSRRHGIPFIEKYVFPNACAPSMTQLAKATEGLLVIEDVQNLGPDYFHTLIAWWKNFDAAWPELRGSRYDDRFYKMWKFYLLGAAGASKYRDGQLYHVVLTHVGRQQPECRAS